jgi:hypothetical protein
MERLNYHEIIEKLDAIDRQLCEMGLHQHDRIRIHRQNIAELAKATDAGTLGQVASDLTQERRREILWSYVESIELVDSLDALQKQGCSVPKMVLERALKGPVDLYLEDEKSNLGRNTMFEIVIAGAAALVGLSPKLGGEPDVLFEFGGRRILVQCKRVLSDSKIPKRITDAAKQLTRDLSQSGDPQDCGVIAISISRLINPGDKILTFATESDMADTLRNEISALIRRHEKALRDVRTPKIAGILFHLATPCYIDEHPLYALAHSATIYPIPGKSDTTLLKNLASFMRF